MLRRCTAVKHIAEAHLTPEREVSLVNAEPLCVQDKQCESIIAWTKAECKTAKRCRRLGCNPTAELAPARSSSKAVGDFFRAVKTTRVHFALGLKPRLPHAPVQFLVEENDTAP